MNIEHFNNLKELIQQADDNGLLLKVNNLTGFSGEKLIGTLQRIAKYQQNINAGNYLEIGVFQGLTLISVASVLDGTIAYGIDNFSQFDPKKINYNLVVERGEKNNLNNIKIINSDYEDALENLTEHIGDLKIGTYFIDGPHDYRSQLLCLLKAKPYLSDFAVIIIDDCNYRHVRLANRDFLLVNPNFKLLFESYTKSHPHNMPKSSENEAKKGWWNGVNIIVYDPNNRLNTMLPETTRDRRLYLNEHTVHSAKYGFLAPEAVFFIQFIISLNLLRAFKQLIKIAVNLFQVNRHFVGAYDSMNTFSENLLEKRFNSFFQ